jgi:putative cell wall-binding protein
MAQPRRGLSSSLLGAVAALAIGVALLAAPPAAAEAAPSNLDRMRAAMAAGEGVHGDRSYAQVDECNPDEAGDEQLLDPEEESTQESEPRADILEHCVNYGPSLSLSVRVAQPTDPNEDPGWQGASFVGWFIDTSGDGRGDYFVEYHLDREGDLVGIVRDLAEDEDSPPTCTVRPAYTGWFAVSGISPSCIGDATDIAVSVGMFYDTDPTQPSGVWWDTAPGGEEFADAPQQEDAREEARLSIPGTGRVETAVAISRYEFPDTAARVYLARADEFPDALAGGVLTDGPILLVPTTGALPQIVREEIARLNPGQVFALGGTSAVSEAMLAQAAEGRQAGRLSIPDTGRVETAVSIARHQFAQADSATEVYLARADDFPDALAGGILTDGPILLVPTSGTVPAIVREEITRLDPDRVIALGGLAAVSDQVLTDAAQARETGRLRIPGGGRIQTAISIAQYEFPNTATEVYLARADDFPDALAGGVLTGGPIILVPSTGTLPPDVADEISRLAPSRVVALGGTAAVSDSILRQAAGN